jgi:CRP-like cAMP-binding protein
MLQKAKTEPIFLHSQEPAAPRSWVMPNVPCKFFDSLRLRDTATILAAARLKSWEPRQVILTAGEDASHLFLLKMGQIKYVKPTLHGEEVMLGLLAPGDVFGLGSLLAKPTKYLATAEAVSTCEVLVWEHHRIRKLARQYPQLAENALRIVLHYLRAYVERHIGLSTMTAEQRLATLLLDLSQRSAHLNSNGIEINATNEQLSAL